MSNAKAEFVDFKAIKQSVTMLQVLDRYGIVLKRSGDNLSGPCPLHGGENPTHFRVSVSKSCFNCFGECKSGGNVLDFVSKKEKSTIRQAALLLQQWFGTGSKPSESASSSSNEPKAEQPQQKEAVAPKQVEPKPTAKESENSEQPAEVKTKNESLGFALKNLDASHAYFPERKLAAETVAAFGLGFCAKGSMAGRIAIPIHNADGKLVAYAGRWPGNPPGDAPKYKLPNGFLKSLEVYNLHNAEKEDPSKPLIVVEGFFDCMTLWQAGVRRVVSVMGSSISDAQVALIGKAATPHGTVIILFDADSAGRTGCEQAVQKLAQQTFVKAVSLCTPGLQPDMLSQFEIAGSPEVAATLLYPAIPFSIRSACASHKRRSSRRSFLKFLALSPDVPRQISANS